MIVALRQILLQALSEVDAAKLKPSIGKALCQSSWDQFQLGNALAALSCHLTGMAYPRPIPKQLPNGAALLDWDGHDRAAQVPDLASCAELGSLWVILGILQDSQELCVAALKLANWLLNLLDSTGFPHLGLWSKGSSNSVPHLLAYQQLLFTLCSRISGEEYFERAAQLQARHFKGWERLELPQKLYEFIAPKLELKTRYRLNPFAEEMTVGMVKWADRDMSVVCSLSGYNSGMGSFHKKEVAITNFGPQAGVLDDLKGFGIERPCSITEKSFADLKWEKEPGGVLIKGWTKIYAAPLWIFSSMDLSNKQLRINIEFQEDKPRDNLSFVFYLKGQKCVVAGRDHIQAYSLDRYQGVNAPLTLLGECEKIYLESGQPGKMSVIPLAGGDFFWGTDFLLAFEIDPMVQNYIWIVK